MDADRLTDERLAELERLAQAATPGPWQLDGGEVFPVSDDDHVICDVSVNEERADADGAYLAAVDPDTVRALVAEVRALREELVQAETGHLASAFLPCPPYEHCSVHCPEAADGR